MTDYSLPIDTDSYKVTMPTQYPYGTTRVDSYGGPRGFPDGWDGFVQAFGTRYIQDMYLAGQVVTLEQAEFAESLWGPHFGNASIAASAMEGWKYIAKEREGFIPIEMWSLPEGMVIPAGNAMFTLFNTDKRVPWLTTWIETLLSRSWYPCTIATHDRQMLHILKTALEETGTMPADIAAMVKFMLHDFGSRGVATFEQACIGGAAHLLNFLGTDNGAGLQTAVQHYGAPLSLKDGLCPGYSIVATEHSTITTHANELAAFKQLLDNHPTGIIACVSDSDNIRHAVDVLWGQKLKEQILARDGKLVVRPDSGHPPDVVCMVLESLGRNFGYTTNAAGYRVLNPKVGVIQGDGIDLAMVKIILHAMKEAGWAASNIAFGSGGGLLQKFNRDDLKWAIKCSYIEGDGFEREVYKDPSDEFGATGKASFRGRLKVVGPPREARTVKQSEPGINLLVKTFKDGEVLVKPTWEEILQHSAAA